MTVSQTTRILHHLKLGKPITPLQALREFHCFRLGARIFELRRKGHVIHKQLIRVGQRQRVAEYRMLKAAQRRAAA